MKYLAFVFLILTSILAVGVADGKIDLESSGDIRALVKGGTLGSVSDFSERGHEGNLRATEEERSTKQEFVAFVKRQPNELFVPTVEKKVRDCLKAYSSREKLPDGSIYGDSVRAYSLENKTAERIHSDMAKLRCAFKEDVLRNPAQNKPIVHDGHTIPIWIYLCPDGGEIRVKPVGNPSNPYRPQANATKGLRYPFNSQFNGFSEEIVKVDNDGNAIPKSRAELRSVHLVEGWAEDAHTDLMK